MVEPIQITVLGAGSVRCATPVVATLATYFGEKPIEVALYDPDEERLDLFARLAKVCCTVADNRYPIRITTEAEEALEGAHIAILGLDDNGARVYQRAAGRIGKKDPIDSDLFAETVAEILAFLRPDGELLSLLRPSVRIPRPTYYRLDWPPEPSPEERAGLPHQVLRWIRGDEYPHELMRRHERSPLKAWLDDRSGALLVSEV
ncbi:MAG: hypothetical protein SNJ74_02015 [Fimbriimonadaceae bacterium]